jgi:predicted regulator of amino acid metabolism with ACT domain
MIRETIKRVLREQASGKVVNFLTYKGLSENDKDKIKINGGSVFTQLKGVDEQRGKNRKISSNYVQMQHPDFDHEQKEESLKQVSHADVSNWFDYQVIELAQ